MHNLEIFTFKSATLRQNFFISTEPERELKDTRRVREGPKVGNADGDGAWMGEARDPEHIWTCLMAERVRTMSTF